MKELKIALVHDYLQEFGGAERVVLALHEAFPQAPLYVGFYDPVGLGEYDQKFSGCKIIETDLQKIPFHQDFRSPLRILAPRAFARLDLQEFDVVIVSTNAYHAKAVRVRPGAALLVYCHTPARSLYGYDTRSDWKKHHLTHFFGEIANHFLRLRDFDDAARATQIVVNSQTVAARVAKFWRQEAQVVSPPVLLADQAELTPNAYQNPQRDYYLFVNRLNLAKHPELAIQAAINLDLPLKIVGDGPAMPALVEQILRSGKTETIQLLGNVPDEELKTLYAGARALLYPVIDEDFGIVPIEAMAYGTPVIAHCSGGPAETIIDGVTGVFFHELTVTALESAIQQAQTVTWDHDAIHQAAMAYSQATFDARIKEIVQSYAKKS